MCSLKSAKHEIKMHLLYSAHVLFAWKEVSQWFSYSIVLVSKPIFASQFVTSM